MPGVVGYLSCHSVFQYGHNINILTHNQFKHELVDPLDLIIAEHSSD